MRGDASEWPPVFRQGVHFLGGWTRREIKPDAHGFLHGKVARGPGIAVAKAEQEIDIGSPRSDAMQRRQDAVGFVGIGVSERIEVEPLVRDLLRNMLERFDFRRRQSEARKPVGARTKQRVVMKRIERDFEPRPDRGRARDRELLADDDCRQSGQSRGPAPELRHAGLREDGAKPRITPRKFFHGVFEIGLRVEAINRVISHEACLALS